MTPIRSIDKIKIGAGRRGPVTEALQRAFFDVINGEVPDTPRLAHLRVPGGKRAPGDSRGESCARAIADGQGCGLWASRLGGSVWRLCLGSSPMT